MAKGEYDFYTLVVCLLILALQIHNPFHTPPASACHCNGDAAPAAAAQAGRRGGPAPAPPPPPPARATAAAGAAASGAPVYRRPREAGGGAGPGGGLSTDELLRELDSIQVKAKEQQETLAAAGRMPPPSPILQQIKESEAAATVAPGSYGAAQGRPRAAVPPAVPPAPARVQPAVPPVVPAAGAAAGAAQMPLMLRRRDDFGRFLQARQPMGLGVVLGVGRGDFALRLLSDWSSSPGLYLVDPYIHIWRGYDDPANLQDKEHQLIFEDLRNRLAPFEGRYVLVRDFSHSFAETYGRGGQTAGPPTFVYVDANPSEEAVSRDLELWWPLLVPGGILAGGTYTDSDDGRVRVRTAVDRMALRMGLQVYLTHDDSPPSWFLLKP